MTKRFLAIACLALAAPLQAQDFATSFDATEVAPGVYMLTGAEGKFGGGNMSVLVGDDQVVLIDDAMVPTAQPVLESIETVVEEIRCDAMSGLDNDAAAQAVASLYRIRANLNPEAA